jgi:hypothetical protein
MCRDRVCTVGLTLQGWLIVNIRCISVLTTDQELDVLRLLFNLKAFLSLCSPAFCYHFLKQIVLSVPVSLNFCKIELGWHPSLLLVTSFSYACLQMHFSCVCLCTFNSSWIIMGKIMKRNNHSALNSQDKTQLTPQFAA